MYMFMRVLRVPGVLRPGGVSDRARLVAMTALAMWVGAAAVMAVDLPVSLAHRLSLPLFSVVMANVLPSGLLLGGVLSAVAYAALLGEGEGIGQVARHAAALSGIAAMVCRAIAVPAVVDASGRHFAAAHAAAAALFGLSALAAAVGCLGIGVIYGPWRAHG